MQKKQSKKRPRNYQSDEHKKIKKKYKGNVADVKWGKKAKKTGGSLSTKARKNGRWTQDEHDK